MGVVETQAAALPAPARTARSNSAATDEWVVGPVRRTYDGPWTGIAVDVDGVPVSFEVLDHAPSRRVEALLTAFAPAALSAGATLRTAEPVDPGWLEGVGRAAALMGTWWGHGADAPVQAPLAAALPHEAAATGGAAGDGVGLCFTGGVDSFWSLLHGHHSPTHLVHIVGYDARPDDTPRIDDQLVTVRAVADDHGLETLFVRTDLRDHPHAQAAGWEQLHGAALAAVGILLCDVIGRLVIPPSYPEWLAFPWGSHPALDRLWSLPGVLDVEHGPADESRLDRLTAIVAEPLARRYLRVCWEHRSEAANCGACEKCIRTMVMLVAAEVDQVCATFPPVDDLPARVRALAGLPEKCWTLWVGLHESSLPAELHDAVADTIPRFDPAQRLAVH